MCQAYGHVHTHTETNKWRDRQKYHATYRALQFALASPFLATRVHRAALISVSIALKPGFHSNAIACVACVA